MIINELSPMPFWWFLIAAFIGYLLGSIPFGLILTKAAGLGDVRTIGSGNIGATNVLRTGNRKLAGATLICDALKGAIAVLIFTAFSPLAGLIAGFFAFLGHLFPVWLKFKGGKGVATYLGVVFAACWLCGFVFLISWLLVAFISRYSSLAALISIFVVAIAAFFIAQSLSVTFIFVLMGAVIIVKHKSNISRLILGEESKIGSKGKSGS